MISRCGLLVAVLFFLIPITACGGDSDSDELASISSVSNDMDAEYEEAEEAAVESDYAPGDSGENGAQFATSFDRRVIRSGELELAVNDVSTAVRQARDTVADRGGYVASSAAQTLSDDRERADLAFEVPSESFESVLEHLRTASYVVRVEHESTSSQDVTEEYIDLQSRLTNLEATEARLVELLEDAHTISDVLSVESEISRVRGEIERIQGRINYLDQRTSYSRIYVSFELAEEDVLTVAGQHFTPVETAREAWNASMEFVGTVGNAIIAVIVFFWWGWPLLGIAALILSRYRRRREPVPAS